MSAQIEEVRKMLKAIPLDSLAQLMKTKELIQEYCEAFKEELNSSKVFEEKGKDWEGDFLFIIGRDKYLDEDIIVYCDLWHGKCREMVQIVSRDEKKTAYVYEGSFENWHKLWTGKTGPVRGILTGKFKLKGKRIKILRWRKAMEELMNCSLLGFRKVGEKWKLFSS